MNDYAFAGDDPVNGSDPSGACPETEIQASVDPQGGVTFSRADGSAPTFGLVAAPLARVTVTAVERGTPLPGVDVTTTTFGVMVQRKSDPSLPI